MNGGRMVDVRIRGTGLLMGICLSLCAGDAERQGGGQMHMPAVKRRLGISWKMGAGIAIGHGGKKSRLL